METMRISSGIALGTDEALAKAVRAYSKRSAKKKAENNEVFVKLPIMTVLALSRLHHYACNPDLGVEIVIVK